MLRELATKWRNVAAWDEIDNRWLMWQIPSLTPQRSKRDHLSWSLCGVEILNHSVVDVFFPSPFSSRRLRWMACSQTRSCRVHGLAYTELPVFARYWRVSTEENERKATQIHEYVEGMTLSAFPWTLDWVHVGSIGYSSHMGMCVPYGFHVGMLAEKL